MVQPLQKAIWQLLKKLNINLTPKRTDNLHPQKDIHTNAHSSIIHNNQTLETI